LVDGGFFGALDRACTRAGGGARPRRRLRILVAEDNDFNGMLMLPRKRQHQPEK
jgi:hypothetical protein